MADAKVLFEKDDLRLVQFAQEMEAVGAMATMCIVAPQYFRLPIGRTVERFTEHVAQGLYGLFEQKGVIVGFATFARLSPYACRVYENDVRGLTMAELVSGKVEWVVDLVAPFGHGAAATKLVFAYKKSCGCEDLYSMRMRPGYWQKRHHNLRDKEQKNAE